MATNFFDVENYTAGDSLTLQVPVTDADGAPQDLSAATLRWGALHRRTGAQVLLTEATGCSVTGDDNNIFRVVVPKDTLNTAGLWWHSFEVQIGADSETVQRGTITALDSPTAT